MCQFAAKIYTSVNQVYTFLPSQKPFPRRNLSGTSIAQKAGTILIPYVATKNSAHESVARRVQTPPREHPIISSAVRDGDEGHGDIFQNRGFQFPGAARI